MGTQFSKKFVTIVALVFLYLPNAFSALAQNSTITSEQIKNKILTQIKKGTSLKIFYQDILNIYGTKALDPLLGILENSRERDEARWVSLYGIVKLSGYDSLPLLKKYYNDKSWMIRDAAIKNSTILCSLDKTPTAQIELCKKNIENELISKLKDDSLIVRTTVVDSISTLKLKNAASPLTESLFDTINFHNEKPLWIHKHILNALVNMQYKQAIPRLSDLLYKTHDPELQTQTVRTLEKLSGKQFNQKPISEQIYLWKREALEWKTF